MEQTFLTDIHIKKVRHLENVTIPLDKEKRKHLILTGKNGSGKTSVLETLVKAFELIISRPQVSEEKAQQHCYDYRKELDKISSLSQNDDSENARMQFNEAKSALEYWESE